MFGRNCIECPSINSLCNPMFLVLPLFFGSLFGGALCSASEVCSSSLLNDDDYDDGDGDDDDDYDDGGDDDDDDDCRDEGDVEIECQVHETEQDYGGVVVRFQA